MQGIKVVVVVVVVWFSFSNRSPRNGYVPPPFPSPPTFLVSLVGNTFRRRVTATIQGIPISLWSRRRWPLFFPMTRCSRRAATAAVPKDEEEERGREEEEARRLIFLLFVNLRAEREKFFFGIQTVVLLFSPPWIPLNLRAKWWRGCLLVFSMAENFCPITAFLRVYPFSIPPEIEIVDHNQPSLPHHCFKSATQFSNRRDNFIYIVGRMVSRCNCEGKKRCE